MTRSNPTTARERRIRRDALKKRAKQEGITYEEAKRLYGKEYGFEALTQQEQLRKNSERAARTNRRRGRQTIKQRKEAKVQQAKNHNPRAITIPLNYSPRQYQEPVWSAMHAGCKRGIIVWHRRSGKDTTGLNFLCTQMFERRGVYWHIFPTMKQGRKAMWEGVDPHTGENYIDQVFPEELIEQRIKDEMMIKLKNGSIYQIVGTENIDDLVGTPPVGVIFSEYPLQDPQGWNLIRPILNENNGWALFVYTPRGRNHGWDLYKQALQNQWPDGRWFVQLLSVTDTKRPNGSPVIRQDDIEEDRKSGMPEELIQQEYYCSFDAGLVGAYYGNIMSKLRKQGRITRVPFDPLLQVSTFWDIGVNDQTAIWFIQQTSREIRAIDYLESSGKALHWYAKKLKEDHREEYNYANHYGPHDLTVREFLAADEQGHARSRVEVAQEVGIEFTICRKHAVEDGVEQVRTFLQRCVFDEVACERGIEALSQHRKVWDEERKIFLDRPHRDWTKHGADAFRIGAMSIEGPISTELPRQASTSFNYFDEIPDIDLPREAIE